jgi:5-methylthioribose kinase
LASVNNNERKMTMTTNQNKPIDTLRDGALKATIWKNESEKGAFYSVDISRTYKVGEQFKDSYSFSGTEPLQVAHLAQQAYDRIGTLRQQDRQANANTEVAQ